VVTGGIIIGGKIGGIIGEIGRNVEGIMGGRSGCIIGKMGRKIEGRAGGVIGGRIGGIIAGDRRHNRLNLSSSRGCNWRYNRR